MTAQCGPEADVRNAAIPLDPSGGPTGVRAPRLERAEVPDWVMIARTGTWLGHPTVPEVIAPGHLRSALDYFERHFAAHGTDLVVDYHHASVVAPRQGAHAPAAGWIKQMELRADGTELWGRVIWTATAANAVERRLYRYLSPVVRFNVPDRVTGEPVPMLVHSVALTNTPFLTELESLNEAAASGGGVSTGTVPRMRDAPTAEGGESMKLLELIAQALEREPEQVASELGFTLKGVHPEGAHPEGIHPEGLEGAADDAQVAGALVANAARVKELEAALADAPAAPDYVCNALGLNAGSEETAVRAAILRLKAPGAGMVPVRSKLGLAEDAPAAEVLNAIEALQQSRRKCEAEELVDGAVAAGRLRPAHRAFYLREALNDLEAAREVVNSLPVLMRTQLRAASPAARRALDEAEHEVCRQLGLTAEAFLRAAV